MEREGYGVNGTIHARLATKNTGILVQYQHKMKLKYLYRLLGR